VGFYILPNDKYEVILLEQKDSASYRYLPMILVLLIWGVMNVPTKFALAEMSPMQLLLMRTSLAVLLLAPAAWIREKKLLPDRSDLLTAVIMGLTGVLGNNLCFFYAVKNTTLTNIAIIFATSPLITTVLAAIFLGERLTLRRVTGILLALCGAVSLLCGGNLTVLRHLTLNKGDLFELTAAFLCSVMTILGRRIRKTSPLVVTLCNMFSSMALILAYLLISGSALNTHLSLKAAASAVYCGFLGSGCAYVLQQTSIKRIGAGATGAFLNASPVLSILSAVFFMGERISLIQVCSAAVIFAGILINAGEKRPIR
jgi:drug/metabolite transporter (DMT)-like permease